MGAWDGALLFAAVSIRDCGGEAWHTRRVELGTLWNSHGDVAARRGVVQDEGLAGLRVTGLAASHKHAQRAFQGVARRGFEDTRCSPWTVP